MLEQAEQEWEELVNWQTKPAKATKSELLPDRKVRNRIDDTWLSQMMQERPSLGPGEVHRLCKVVKVFDEKLRATLSSGRLSPFTKALSVS